jgi:hypothetical protein
MSNRKDISDKLVHFTSGESLEIAFQRLCKIISDRRILGTNEKIKGAYKCVCFSEAPLRSLPGGLVNPDAYSRYSPFGIMFEKNWIFAKGGRPVIYQTDEEFSVLPETIKWRHVRYEPNGERPIDFTWEREWRIQCDYLPIDPATAIIVIPKIEWAQRLEHEHDAAQDFIVRSYAEALDDDTEALGMLLREVFPWKFHLLG